MDDRVVFELPRGIKVEYSGITLELVDSAVVVTEQANWESIEINGKRPERYSEQQVLELDKGK